MSWLQATVIVVITVIVAAAAGDARTTGSLMALGRHLAQECASCHRLDGGDNGIPPIVGLEADYFIETIGFYKSGERDNPAMVSVAQSLDDEQIKALSLYFGSLSGQQSAEAPVAAPSVAARKERKR
ncbi:MAG: c-type cytochrome [Hyphomicrobiaceae bacterium]|nr:c-type cytochrome [Hyphomicrobiaceae bacterium]